MSRFPAAGFAMDGIRFDVPSTLLDFVGQVADLIKKQRARRRRATYRSQVTPGGEGTNYAVLVQRDHLFFRVLCRCSVVNAKAIEDSFRSIFADIWDRIPEPDRKCLLLYWRGESDGPPAHHPCHVPYCKPCI